MDRKPLALSGARKVVIPLPWLKYDIFDLDIFDLGDIVLQYPYSLLCPNFWWSLGKGERENKDKT